MNYETEKLVKIKPCPHIPATTHTTQMKSYYRAHLAEKIQLSNKGITIIFCYKGQKGDSGKRFLI